MVSRSQYQGLEGKRDRSNYDYSKLKKEEGLGPKALGCGSAKLSEGC